MKHLNQKKQANTLEIVCRPSLNWITAKLLSSTFIFYAQKQFWGDLGFRSYHVNIARQKSKYWLNVLLCQSIYLFNISTR